MEKTCVVCIYGKISVVRQLKSIDIMLQYVLGYQRKLYDYLCKVCYDELKIAFHFKKKFHKSKRTRLKDLRKDRTVVERDHDYAEQTENLILEGEQLTTDAEKEFKKLTVFDKIEDKDLVVEKRKSGTISQARKRQNLKCSAEQKWKAESRDGGVDKIKNDTTEQNDITCPPVVSKNIKVQDYLEEDKSKTNDSNQEEFTNIEYLENEEEPHSEEEELCYVVDLLGSAENLSLRDPLEQENDKENCDNIYSAQNQDRKMMLNLYGNLNDTQCEYCFESFSNVEELEDHTSNHKKEARPYRCTNSHCTSRFKHKGSLRHHMISHMKEVQYKCRFCAKKFHQINHMKVHERVHSGEMPWRCSDCGKGFKLKEVFMQHIANHTGEKPYECRHCFKTFKKESWFENHLRIHTKGTPFECRDCGRSFSCLGRLEIHRRIHTGIKPFKCQVCNSAFISSSGLIKHWRMYSHFRPATAAPDLSDNK